jgi:signal transduction histidine kinase
VEPPRPERILVHAPYGRDGEIIADVLGAAGLDAEVCPTIADVCDALRSETGTVVIADESLSQANVATLSKILDGQEAWSDLPLIVLTGNGEPTDFSRYRWRLLKPLGNVTLLQRPLRTETAVSAVEAALRARRRQYEVRALLKSLQKTNAELKATNRELEEFSYIASHDLQEPLRMVNIYVDLILRSVGAHPDDETSRFAAFVHKGIKRMEVILRDLLRFSRLIHEPPPLAESASLSDALQDALQVLDGRLQDCGATIVCGAVPEVLGSQAQFSHVFENLISNCIKYRKRGEPLRVRISSQRDGERWVIAVEDNGIGFEQEHAVKIFGLFKRLHRDEYPGTGVGLAICKRIVERHGGEIWAESYPGRGSRFSFAVPVSDHVLVKAS